MKATPRPIRSPYLGLRPFDTGDAPIFFGREAQVDAMLRKLEDHRFVAVVGSSGSGKSSLVRAGLIPAIRGGLLFGVKDWLITVMRPGAEPYERLARGLLEARDNALGEETSAERTVDASMRLGLTIAALRSGKQGLAETITELGVAPGTHALLVVDQFEELFGFRLDHDSLTASVSRDVAAEFVNLLLTAAARKENRLWIVLTIRSDFIGHCDAFLDLPAAVSRSQFLVPRPDLQQIEDAIVRPGQAGAVDYGHFDFADGLVRRMGNDTAGSHQDVLPLMQHALMRTWEYAKVRGGEVCLNVDDYNAVGGLGGALSEHADQALKDLKESPGSEEIARVLFSLLSDSTTDGQIVRRRPTVREVMEVAGASLQDVGKVVHAFQDDQRNFVFTSPEGPVTEETRLDVSHEALLRRWGVLNGPEGWLTQERLAAAELRRLVAGAEHYRLKRGGLLPGPDIDRIRYWLRSKREKSREAWALRYIKIEEWRDAIAYYEESRAEQLRATQEKLKSEREQVDQRKRNRNILFGLIAALAIALLSVGKMAWDLHRKKLNLTDSLHEQQKLATDRAALASKNVDLLKEAHDKETQEKERVRSVRGRSEYYRSLAEELITSDTRELTIALRNLSTALRLDPGNQDTVKSTCDLLATRNWCVPRSATIRVPYGAAGQNVFLEEDGTILVVSRDGHLYHGRESDFGLTQGQSVLQSGPGQPPEPDHLPPQNPSNPPSAPSETPPRPRVQFDPKVLAAAFSDDGRYLIVLPAEKSKAGRMCVIWRRTDKGFEFMQETEVGDEGNFHNILWSPDDRFFALTRWDEPHFRLFRLEGKSFGYIPSLSKKPNTPQNLQPNAQRNLVICFHPGGKILAVASFSEKPEPHVDIQVLDANTLLPVALGTPAQPNRSVAIKQKPAQMFFGPGEDRLTMLSWGAPPVTVSLSTGLPDANAWTLPLGSDNPLRIVPGPLGPISGTGDVSADRAVACCFGDRVEIRNMRNIGQPIREAILPRGLVGGCAFNPQGTRLVTLSGSSWAEQTYLRVWDVTARGEKPVDPSIGKGPEPAPEWLGDLASVVSGHEEESATHSRRFERTIEDASDSSWHPVRNFDELGKQYARKIDGNGSAKYEPIWERYFPVPAQQARSQ